MNVAVVAPDRGVPFAPGARGQKALWRRTGAARRQKCQIVGVYVLGAGSIVARMLFGRSFGYPRRDDNQYSEFWQLLCFWSIAAETTSRSEPKADNTCGAQRSLGEKHNQEEVQ